MQNWHISFLQYKIKKNSKILKIHDIEMQQF